MSILQVPVRLFHVKHSNHEPKMAQSHGLPDWDFNRSVLRLFMGLLVFRSIPDAMRAGYQVYDRIDSGYLVRTRTAKGWELAVVDCLRDT